MSEARAVAAMALYRYAQEECGWGTDEWHLCEEMADVVLDAFEGAARPSLDRPGEDTA